MNETAPTSQAPPERGVEVPGPPSEDPFEDAWTAYKYGSPPRAGEAASGARSSSPTDPGTAGAESPAPAGGEDTPGRFTQISLTRGPLTALYRAGRIVLASGPAVHHIDGCNLADALQVLLTTLELEGWL